MSLTTYTSKTWTDYADSPCLEAVELNRIDSGIAAVTAELLALEASLPTTYQPISAELSALAALSSTGYAKRSGAAAWSVISSIPQADVSGLTTALAGRQPLDADLTAISALATTGFVRRTAADTWAASTLVWSDISSGHPSVTAGTGLSGGGALTNSVTLSVAYGTATGTACVGNDSRVLNGQTAYSWGNHAAAGYLTAASSLDPAKVAQTASYRFVTDAEKVVWNSKQSAITTGTTAQYLRGDLSLAAFPTTWAGTALTGLVPDANIASAAAWNAKQASSSVLTSIAAQSSGTGLLRLAAGVASLDTTAYQPVSGMSSYLTTAAAVTTYLAIGANAVSASKLQTARTIAGVSFDGSANISISYANLTSIPSTFTPSAHNQAWSTITGTPTTLAGYGITDAVSSSDSRLTDTRTPTNQSWYVIGDNASCTRQGSGTNSQNTLRKSGFYSYSTWEDSPVANTWTHLIHSQYHNDAGSTNAWSFDIAANFGTVAYPGSAENYYMRCIAGGTSTGWRKLWHDGNLTPGNYLPLAGGTMSGNINLNKFSITSGSTSLGDGMVSSIGGNFTNLQVLTLIAASGFSKINLCNNLIPSTDSGVNLGQLDKRLLASYSVYSYLSYLDASAEVAGPVVRWKDRIVIGSGGVLPIVGDGCAIVAVGQGTGQVTNKPTTNNCQSVSYRKSDGTLATAAAGGNVIDLDLYGRCAFIVGVSSSQAQLIV